MSKPIKEFISSDPKDAFNLQAEIIINSYFNQLRPGVFNILSNNYFIGGKIINGYAKALPYVFELDKLLEGAKNAYDYLAIWFNEDTERSIFVAHQEVNQALDELIEKEAVSVKEVSDDKSYRLLESTNNVKFHVYDLPQVLRVPEGVDHQLIIIPDYNLKIKKGGLINRIKNKREIKKFARTIKGKVKINILNYLPE